MKVEYRNINEIIPYEKNAKRHDKTQIKNVAEPIRQYGWAQPIVIDGDNVVIIGHCRLLAAKQLHLSKVSCLQMDKLAPEQVNALRIVDNKSNESDWDMDFLVDELAEVDLSMFDFDFGLEDEEEEEQGGVELEDRELTEYQYIHYLVTVDTNSHDLFVDKIKELENMGAEVKMTRNNT